MAVMNTRGSGNNTIRLDALVVGAGFGGCYLLHLLRDRGLNVKLVDAQDAVGGTWRANSYPGARVDCFMPYYLLSAPELMEDWTWTEKFPGYQELQAYFDHVDKTWELSKDTFFNTRITEAKFDDDEQRWHVSSHNGKHFNCQWFLQATGSSHTQHIPDWPGTDMFRGEMYHPASWPREDPIERLRGKRVAVIGAGASAIQIVQESAKVASSLTQFIRSPNFALPMEQRAIPPEEVEALRLEVPRMMREVRATPLGLPYFRNNGKTLDASPEEREELWSKNWEIGGFAFSSASFEDIVTDKEANRLAYEFWRKKQGSRVPDPHKRELLMPSKQPYWFATKRPSMEQDYYEMISLPHAEVTDSPITHLDETGIVTKDGVHRPFDVIAVATGYDAVTGSLISMNIVGRQSVSLKDSWSKGVKTMLGMCVAKMPNMFFVYGPQAPTSFTSGPPFIEQQCEWICEVIDKAKANDWQCVEATEEGQEQWTELNRSIANQTLTVETDSWYMGANVPGKVREPLLFLGGMPSYFEKCKEALDGMKGFECSYSLITSQRDHLGDADFCPRHIKLFAADTQLGEAVTYRPEIH